MPHFCCDNKLSCPCFQYATQTEMKGTVNYNIFKQKHRPWHLDAKSKINVTCRFSHFSMITRTTAMAGQMVITKTGKQEESYPRAGHAGHSKIATDGKAICKRYYIRECANVWCTPSHWGERISQWLADVHNTCLTYTPAHAWCLQHLWKCTPHSLQKMHMRSCMRAYATEQKLLCYGSYCELILSLARASCRLLFAARSGRPSSCVDQTWRPTLFAEEIRPNLH